MVWGGAGVSNDRAAQTHSVHERTVSEFMRYCQQLCSTVHQLVDAIVERLKIRKLARTPKLAHKLGTSDKPTDVFTDWLSAKLPLLVCIRRSAELCTFLLHAAFGGLRE